MATVLVVDDEFAIRRLLRHTLERAGHAVVEAGNAREALAAVASARPDLVLLDLGLPDRDGLELLPLLPAPVLVVSAREATDEKVAALDLGAVDYVTKPFDSEELLARLRVALRRSREEAPAVIAGGGLVIDRDRRRVTCEGVEVHLTRKEYDVLCMLAVNAGRVITHEKLLAEAWPSPRDARIEYLRIVIRNIRHKFKIIKTDGEIIKSELGVGYRLSIDTLTDKKTEH